MGMSQGQENRLLDLLATVGEQVYLMVRLLARHVIYWDIFDDRELLDRLSIWTIAIAIPIAVVGSALIGFYLARFL
jgi:hypothetical protein